ncbi:hypothetical protein FD754_001208 [Muntiacus muntjak]|uniref:Vacuolar protein sorting-associated protein 33A n=1 Tax=Muntiacus muntjak TaxID=9888 RepID=A0A5N3W617_MUNMU|nr:hypothetical protein FD754_001208 [Muntiacus muntjak]
MAAHLSYGRVNLNVLREAVRRELREFLDKCAGSKAIVWDEYLIGPFGLIAQYLEKMFMLKGSRLPAADVKNIIFFVRPRLELMDIIAENVLRRGPARDFHILFVPRHSLLCEQWLKDLGVLGSFIHREEYSLDLIPFDGDLLSMESEGAFKECYLESDQTSLYHAAKGLMTLQALYGTIPQIFGKGECARQVANMMIRMKREFTGSQNSIFPVFDNLLLLDRNVDLLSPLATQLTYEGLIDEIYGIQNNSKLGSHSGKLVDEVALVLGLERWVEFRGALLVRAGSVIPVGNHGANGLVRQRAQRDPFFRQALLSRLPQIPPLLSHPGLLPSFTSAPIMDKETCEQLENMLIKRKLLKLKEREKKGHIIYRGTKDKDDIRFIIRKKNANQRTAGEQIQLNLTLSGLAFPSCSESVVFPRVLGSTLYSSINKLIFSCGQVAKLSLSSQCRGPGFDPWSGN